MFTKSPLPLVFLLCTSVLAAAQSCDNYELRTQVPYYMAPLSSVGGGVAPARVGDEECPSAVNLTTEPDLGVPIKFSTSAYDSGESAVIDENTDVYISFNDSVCEEQKSWGYRLPFPLPDEIILELLNPRIDERPPSFRIEKVDIGYRVSSPPIVESGWNVRRYSLTASNGNLRLGLPSVGESLACVFSVAGEFQGVIKSVV